MFNSLVSFFSILSPICLLAPFKSNDIVNIRDNSTYFNIVQNEIVSVKEEYLSYNDLRIYGNEFSDTLVTSIADGAFSSCTDLTSLMITDGVTINGYLPSSIETIYLTGKKDNFTYVHPSQITILEEQFDEGFINKWNKEVRPSKDSDLCKSISTQEQFQVYNNLYLRLKNATDQSDYEFVNAYVDKSGTTIKTSMEYLNSIYGSVTPKQSNKMINKTSMIVVVLLTASIGMTSIVIFYILKDKKVIN